LRVYAFQRGAHYGLQQLINPLHRCADAAYQPGGVGAPQSPATSCVAYSPNLKAHAI